MKKTLINLSLAIAMAFSCVVGASACTSDPSIERNDRAAACSEIVPFSLGNSVSCKNNSGDSDPFTIHKNGRVRFYFTNNSDIDIIITIHKQGLLGSWGGNVTVNGQSEFKIPANKSIEFDTDGSKMSKGTYRCEAFNEDGSDFNYVCALRELDYTP